MSAPPVSSRPPAQTGGLLRVSFYLLAVGMALIHAFITFRGISSAQGMEQAQIARELARGQGFVTKTVRPYDWAQLRSVGQSPDVAAMPSLTQPPLQPLLLAPLFSALKSHQVYDSVKNGSIYLLDRAMAGVGVTGLLIAIFLVHGVARKLFDDLIAGIAALCLVLSGPLWQVAVSGGSRALLIPLFALAFRLLVSASLSQRSAFGTFLLLGIVSAAMVLTHWLAIWLVAGLVVAIALCFPGKRSGAVIVATLSLTALGIWCWWTYQRCGDVLGGAKSLFQAHLLSLDVEALQRDFSTAAPPIFPDDILRKLGQNWLTQMGDGYAHLCYLLPSLFFLPALLHRFRRPETTACLRALAVVVAFTALGMGLVGLPERAADDDALFVVLSPVMAVFGVAFLAVLWVRLQPAGGRVWTQWGYAMVAILVSALPLAVSLPAQLKMGLTMAGRFFPHWPPYVPDRVSVVRKLLEPHEVIFSDAPWFVSWYADVPAVWIPVKRKDFPIMESEIKTHGHAVAGFLVTPVSAKVNYLLEAFDGPYREWPDLVFRGPMLAFDKEFLPYPDFPYKVPLPLVANTVGDKESLSLWMTFYTDKVRTLENKAADE